MSHRIRDAERRQIRSALETENRKNWIKIASEIDYERNQIYFWFLIPDRSVLDDAVPKVMRIIRPFLLEREGVQFNVTFIELANDEEIRWETLDDAELRRGRVARSPGSDPWRSARRPFTAFDRPDYSIPPADEPI